MISCSWGLREMVESHLPESKVLKSAPVVDSNVVRT